MVGDPDIDDVILRRATGDDLPEIERLFSDGALFCAGEVRRIHGVLVADAKGSLAGLTGLEVLGGDGLVRAMCVANGWQTSDLPRLLIEATLTEGALNALDAVYLFTDGAQPFFARFGFLVIHRNEVPSAVYRWAEMNGGIDPGAVAMRVTLIDS